MSTLITKFRMTNINKTELSNSIAAAKEEMQKKFEEIIKNLEKSLNEEKTKNVELEGRIKKLEETKTASFTSLFNSTSKGKSTEQVAILNARSLFSRYFIRYT